MPCSRERSGVDSTNNQLPKGVDFSNIGVDFLNRGVVFLNKGLDFLNKAIQKWYLIFNRYEN